MVVRSIASASARRSFTSGTFLTLTPMNCTPRPGWIVSSGVPWRLSNSSVGTHVCTSMQASNSPARNDCSAVVASGIIFASTRVMWTDAASRQPLHFWSAIEELCCHAVRRNGPFVTMFLGSVHFSPNCSTVARWTARNEVCAICCTNHGCGVVSPTSSVASSRALTPTLSRSCAQFFSQALYSCAPSMPMLTRRTWAAFAAFSPSEPPPPQPMGALTDSTTVTTPATTMDPRRAFDRITSPRREARN
jgi:hypothetical protein